MFNNPYNFYPYMNINPMNLNAINTTGKLAKGGLFKSLSGIKWGNILNNTQKTLNVINQAIPVYYQIKPIWNNMKSFNRILTAFNTSDDNQNNNLNKNLTNEVKKKKESSNTPTFFIN